MSVLLLFGATGVGKSRLLAASDEDSLTGEPSAEIISADSRQVYRSMDIGTAKPSPAERRRIPHHLIDIIDPDEAWDVGRFVAECDRLVPEIEGRGRRAIISGGTAFYVRGYLFGLPRTPQTPPELRTRLAERLETEGLDALRDELRRIDPASDERIAANDRYRVLRALEVYHTSGRPLSEYTVPKTPRSDRDIVAVGLYRERGELYRRIDERVDAMFEAGLPREVELLARRGYGASAAGMRAIGYREFFSVGGPPPWGAVALEHIRRAIARNSRRYAKRQETFFRRLPGVRWIHAEDNAAREVVLDRSR